MTDKELKDLKDQYGKLFELKLKESPRPKNHELMKRLLITYIGVLISSTVVFINLFYIYKGVATIGNFIYLALWSTIYITFVSLYLRTN